jgi:tellurite resistance protein TerC
MALYFLGFIALVIGLLILDLAVLHRKDEVMSVKGALGWTIFWVALSLLFNALIYLFYERHWFGIGTTAEMPTTGIDAALTFFTAYIVEKSLSIDNIFVIAMVFSYFHIPDRYQHRVLFWGILGALVMRGIMIAIGIVSISYFSWLTYVLGGLLVVTAIRMMVAPQDSFKPERSLIVRIVQRWFLITTQLYGHHFFVRLEKKWMATPLFLSLILIESTDLLFAIDSIPAVLAITLDPFIVFTSNVCAILGMRSLYFVLASMMDRFRYLKHSLVFILGFVGIKMILAHYLPINAMMSLAVIICILCIGIVASYASEKF